jgi:hypothetical protein
VNKLICAVLIAGAVCGAAKVAEAESSPPSCFNSAWDYLKSSVRDCPLRYGPFTVYGALDGGFGYEKWGAPLGTYADKPNYAIQRSSGNTHWLWSPNALSTSTIGVRFSQEVAKDWEILGVAEAGFNPYTMRLINGPQSLANNNLLTPANQTTHFDLARAGTWDNGQGFVGISNPTYGTRPSAEPNCCLSRRLARTIPWRRSRFPRSASPLFTRPSAPVRPPGSIPRSLIA